MHSPDGHLACGAHSQLGHVTASAVASPIKLQLTADWPVLVTGKVQKIAVCGHRMTNDGRLVREWYLAGDGIVRKSIGMSKKV
jgi:hypothetical protein